MLAVLLLASAAHSQENSASQGVSLAAITDPNTAIKTLDEWDQAVNLLARGSWQAHQAASADTEILDQPLGYYWDQHLLVPEQKAKLDQLREKARQQSEKGDDKGLQATIAEASALLAAEKYKVGVLMTFSYAAGSVTYQRSLLDPWLARAAPAERTSADQQTDAGHGALVKALGEAARAKKYDAAYVKAMNDSSHPLLDALNAQRLRLIKEQASLPNPISLPPVSRATSCPDPVPPAKDRDRPSLGSNFPSSEDFYPAAVKRALVQGSVTLHTMISETGCLMRAEVVESSGDQALDQGALELAMAGRFVPGSKDGKAVAGEMKFRVKFELRD
jgi:TonB family protein